MNLPLVSIGVPTYNRAATLGKTLESLISQTYTNIEILISDDCSSDPSVEKLISHFLNDPRVIYFRHPKNIGMIANFNFLLEKCSGEFFLRLADDDWIDSDYIEKCTFFLIENPEYSSAYGLAKYYTVDRNFLTNDAIIDLTDASSHKRVTQYYNLVNYNGTSYGIMRRKHLPLLYTSDIIAADWLTVARVAFTGKYKMLDNTHSHIYGGGESQSFDYLTRRYGPFTKSFPYTAVCFNVLKDTMFAKVYKETSFFNRLKLSIRSCYVISKKYKIGRELISGVKKYFKLLFKLK